MYHECGRSSSSGWRPSPGCWLPRSSPSAIASSDGSSTPRRTTRSPACRIAGGSWRNWRAGPRTSPATKGAAQFSSSTSISSKRVNDSLGHAAGDDLLMRLGALLRRLLRESDLVARWAGDEFTDPASERRSGARASGGSDAVGQSPRSRARPRRAAPDTGHREHRRGVLRERRGRRPPRSWSRPTWPCTGPRTRDGTRSTSTGRSTAQPTSWSRPWRASSSRYAPGLPGVHLDRGLVLAPADAASRSRGRRIVPKLRRGTDVEAAQVGDLLERRIAASAARPAYAWQERRFTLYV